MTTEISSVDIEDIDVYLSLIMCKGATRAGSSSSSPLLDTCSDLTDAE